MNEIVTSQGNTPATYSDEDIQLIRDTCASGCTDTEFKLYLHLARAYKLDPLARQIWAVKYGNNPAQIFCGRDGYIAIAHMSGQFDGMESGSRVDEDSNLIGWCKVFRRGMSHPFLVEVYESEYNTGKALWKSKPRTMIQKVAEAQCLRRAFSITGLYSPEEIDTGDRQRQMHDITPQRASFAAVDNTINMSICAKCGAPILRDIAEKSFEHAEKPLCIECFKAWWEENKTEETKEE